ncbi:MAG: HAMP domain-containing histidine kinase, partial [Actinomycetota bacterium]|nr:HAMP domain-containing histidine kinase [Actinomycetota bacterium]
MPRRIALLVAATTSAVVVAFIVPLCFLVASLAQDRATTRAQEQARNVAALLVSVSSNAALADAVASLDADGPRVAVVWPDNRLLGGQEVSASTRALVARVQIDRGAFTASTPEGLDALVPVVTPEGVTVVVASVSNDELRSGVPRAWATMIALGLLLVGISVAGALRLGRFISVPVTEVAEVAHRLREGDGAARAVPGGPPETAELGRALNALADRIRELVEEEREQVADLGHRLRTPVTALRLDADLVTDVEVGDRLREHIDHLQRSIDVVVREARRGVADEIPVTTVVAPVVAERVAFWTALAEDQGRRLDLEVGGAHDAAVVLAVDDLRELVDTLLDNVFTHTPDGAPIAVRVKECRGSAGEGGDGPGDLAGGAGSASVVGLVVEDGGPGLVTPWRGRGHSAGGSTGLGLDIVHRIAHAGAGRVDLDQSSLGGLRVTVSLPGKRRDPYAADAAEPRVRRER